MIGGHKKALVLECFCSWMEMTALVFVHRAEAHVEEEIAALLMKQSESTKKLLSGIVGDGEKSSVKLTFNAWKEYSKEMTAEMIEEEKRLELEAAIQAMKMEITSKLESMKYR